MIIQQLLKPLLLPVFLFAFCAAFAQDINKIVNQEKVLEIESVLASDAMKGRRINSPEIAKAAEYISDQFKAAGLQPLDGNAGFLQRFNVYQANLLTMEGMIGAEKATKQNVVIVTKQPDLHIDENSGYEVKTVAAGDDLYSSAVQAVQSGKNYLVMIDAAFASKFTRLEFFKKSVDPSTGNVVFLLGNSLPAHFNIDAKHRIDTLKLFNVAGMLPGKTRKDEYVIFSSHYDHLGIGKAVNGDSIYNGANDDASGSTAVIMLAKYFSDLKNNDRTIIFTTFTAEESGGFGSRYFSRQLDPDKVVAMFNIEMIGTTSKWGTNSAYITGFEKSDMGKILQQNLNGTDFGFYPDPYPQEQLFYRSDNATLARLGVPAHTISTSKMDNEPNYHQPGDEVSTLDTKNMAAIIRAIALSSISIVAGKDTPARVDASALK